MVTFQLLIATEVTVVSPVIVSIIVSIISLSFLPSFGRGDQELSKTFCGLKIGPLLRKLQAFKDWSLFQLLIATEVTVVSPVISVIISIISLSFDEMMEMTGETMETTGETTAMMGETTDWFLAEY